MDPTRWVALAEVARPHGVRGELRLRVYNADSDLLLERETAHLRDASGREREVTLQWARPADDAILCKLVGIDDRDAAEALRGATLSVRREDFPPPDDDEFYVCDVLGARVSGPGGNLGVVVDFASYPTADALVVKRAGTGERVEVPLIAEMVERVDAAAGEVALTPEAAVYFP